MAASLDPRFHGGDNLQASLPDLSRPLARQRAPERLLAVRDENEMNVVGGVQTMGKRPPRPCLRHWLGRRSRLKRGVVVAEENALAPGAALTSHDGEGRGRQDRAMPAIWILGRHGVKHGRFNLGVQLNRHGNTVRLKTPCSREASRDV